MKRYLLFATLLLLVLSCGRGERYIQIRGYAQGGVYSVKLNTEGVELSPEEIRYSIDSILTLIDTTLSGYNRGSLLSRFNRGETIRPNELFMDMYGEARRWYELSEGAIDCAAGPVFDIWGFGFTRDSLPSGGLVEKTLASCGMARLQPSIRPLLGPDGTLSPSDLLLPESSSDALPVLNYNAVAQGLSCDLVSSWLSSVGVKDMLVDIGEIFCDGVNPSGEMWTVGIDRPSDGNNTPGADLEGVWKSDGGPCGLVTSGNYRKFYVHEGRKYSHTIDPRTGFPSESTLLSATVAVHPAFADGGTSPAAAADALATWCMVIGTEKSRELILSLDGVEACLIFSDADGSMVSWRSPGF